VDLYLIRHGNAQKLRGESYVNAPLTELGRKQAALTGEYLSANHIHFDGFYCSPLKRAVETAAIIGEHIGQKPELRLGLHEIEYRELPATLALELVARTGLLSKYFNARVGKPLRVPMIGRVARVVLALMQAHPEGQVAIVVHGGVISSVLAWYLPGERRRWWRDTVGNCSITHLELEDGRARVIVFDQVSHLAALAPEAHRRNYTFSASAQFKKEMPPR